MTFFKLILKRVMRIINLLVNFQTLVLKKKKCQQHMPVNSSKKVKRV